MLDILILSNGPGEVSTWVRPAVRALRERSGDDRQKVRISVMLSPCTHATGRETDVVRGFGDVDRVQSPEHFYTFLLTGKTADNWDWSDRGIVLFLGGDQIFPLIIGKRLNYRTVIYAEWEGRWYRRIDRFGVMNERVLRSIPPEYHPKFTVIGDLMVDLPPPTDRDTTGITIAILPGSKPSKLSQGVPLTLSIAESIHRRRPDTSFIIPVAPTLKIPDLMKFGNPDFNPMIARTGWTSAGPDPDSGNYLITKNGLKVELIRDFPAHAHLSTCKFALTTVGANTAELGALCVPMIVLLPTQELDAMRAWDGLPGLLARLPLLGSLFAKTINTIILSRKRLYAWPNIWAGEEVIPELVGRLEPDAVARLALSWLDNPDELERIRQKLRSIRGPDGASDKLANIVLELAEV